MLDLKRARQDFSSELGPERLSWDYPPRFCEWMGFTVALITCGNGHTLCVVAPLHSIDDAGVVLPLYACTVPGCGFAAIVRLEGWNPLRREPLA